MPVYMVYGVRCTLYSERRTAYTVYTAYIVYGTCVNCKCTVRHSYIVYTNILHIMYITEAVHLYTIQCNVVCTVHCTMYTSTMYNEQNTVYSVQGTIYSVGVQCTMYNIQCTL